MNAMTYAGVNAALNVDGALKPYYMGIDLSAYPLPLVAFGVVATYVGAICIGLLIMERL